MHLGHVCETTPKVVLNINNNALMNIGDGNTRTASVLVQEGHEIEVNNNGNIYVKNGSTLKITEGSKLMIKNGGSLIIENGGLLLVEEGGQIDFYEGGNIALNGENAKLVLDGKIHLYEKEPFH